MLGLNRTKQIDVTEEEIHSLIDEGHTAGLIETEERQMITGVMRLGDRTVRAIMTPRPDIVWLDPSRSAEENMARIRDSDHSRFPLAETSVDHVVGVVQAKHLLTRPNGLSDMRAAMHPPVVVPETLSVLRLLDAMRDTPVRMVFVADEYGVIQGIVTAADLLESIAGDGALSADEAITSPVQREDGSWLVDGMTPIDEFERLVSVPGLSDEGSFDTVAGLVMQQLGRMPRRGETVQVEGLELKVLRADRRRIEALKVTTPRDLPAQGVRGGGD